MILYKSSLNWESLKVKDRIKKIQNNAESIGMPIDWETAKKMYNEHVNCTIWTNETYQVNHYAGKQANFIIHLNEIDKNYKDKIDYLSIKRRDKKAIHDWRDLQEIKNFVVGSEREAVELYPKESRLVDSANQYHLFVFPEDYTFPFGFTERFTMYEDLQGGVGKTGQRGK